MTITEIYCVFFSATGNTKKVAQTLAQSLSRKLDCPWQGLDFTLPEKRTSPLTFGPSQLVILGLPTYAGKLPNKILPFLESNVHGADTPAIALVTFGNRSFDNALAELQHTLTQNHFQLCGGAALACRHAFTDKLAFGRPNERDLAELETFAGKMADKISSCEMPLPPLSIPGKADAPYYIPKGVDGQPAKFLKAKPQTREDRCTSCGLCARLCPMGAISPAHPWEIPGTCIKCQRCVRSCPEKAKYFSDPAFLSHVTMLEENFQTPKPNAFYL